MKKIYLLLGILIFATSVFGNTNINFGISSEYADNIFNLSNQDIDKYDAGAEAFNFIKTKDDLIVKSFFSISQKIISNKLQTSPFFLVSQQNFIENNLKSKTLFKFGVKNKYANKINTTIAYSFSPKIFVRKYIDYDGTEKYEAYQYDKQKFDFNGYYKINGKNFIFINTSLSQLFYDKYFTEYDGIKYSGGLGFKHSLKPFYLKINYSYAKFEGYDKILSPEEYEGYVRDPRYESNLYSLMIQSKKIKFSSCHYLRIKLVSNFEQRYFTTDLNDILDPIHSGRKDYIYNYKLKLDYKLSTGINIFLDLSNTSRKVSANYEDLSKIKNYQSNKITLGFAYLFSL